MYEVARSKVDKFENFQYVVIQNGVISPYFSEISSDFVEILNAKVD